MAKTINFESNLTEKNKRVVTVVKPNITLNKNIETPVVTADNVDGVIALNGQFPDVGRKLTDYINTNEPNISSLRNHILSVQSTVENSNDRINGRLQSICNSLDSTVVAVKNIEIGSSNVSIPTKAGQTLSITFNQSYSHPPFVVVSPVVDGNFEVCLKIKSINNSKFYCYCYNNTANTITVQVNYIAIPYGNFDSVTSISSESKWPTNPSV